LTSEDMIRVPLKLVVDIIKENSFQKEYRDKATDAECLGIAIAKYFEWGFKEITETASAAFEDANFSSFNEQFEDLQKRSVGGDKY